VTGGEGVPRLPIVAIVGRPNVGKSTLFNRLVRARRAIVDDVPGVTRDRIVAPAAHGGRAFLCVDTGGLTEERADPRALTSQVRAQALRAIDEADCIVCVVDGPAGLTPIDRETVRLVRRSGKPLVLAVNKVDSPAREALLHDFHAAGTERLLAVSAAHGRGITALKDTLVSVLPSAAAIRGDEATPTRLALLGRPNVGKSSLLNRLLGEERAIVAPEPGTTRDPIDMPLVVHGRPYVLIDTAGIRRRARVRDPLERHGAVRALGTLTRTDLALVVLDAAEGMTDQDARVVSAAWEAGRGVVLLANKWDAVVPARHDRTAFQRALRGAYPAFGDLPLVCISARTGEGLADIFPAVARVERAYRAVLPTPALNRALRGAVAAHAPPSPRGRPLRLLYATQTGERPPAVTVFGNAPTVPRAYARYLEARLGDAFGLVGVPLRLRFVRGPSRRAPAGDASAR
jgi:GTP-binding protein